MVEKLLQLLAVSCRHRKISQPFTAATATSSARAVGSAWESVSTTASHYVVCLECGKKFSYDWDHMRIVR
jgi:predicted transcriptional regulator